MTPPFATLPITLFSSHTQTEDLLLKLRAWNYSIVGRYEFTPLRLGVAGPDGNAIAGIDCETSLGCLFIHVLWLPPELRGAGLGRELMARAEAEAITRGCHTALVDTMDWQARPFYEKCGYAVFGTLPDVPLGHKRFFMSKKLVTPAPAAPQTE
jgi:GNAT superfamily N-acetyltransferase